MGNREWRIQLKDAMTGEAIITAGGTVYVATNGDAQKATLYTAAGASLANPITPTRGFINFFAADTVEKVDLYGMAPGGEAFVLKNVSPSGPNEIEVDTGRLNHVLVIPFSIADTTATTETDTGFDTGTDKLWLPTPFIKVSTIDATETIDVGTDGSGANDADGFINAVALDSAVAVKATLLASGDTMGALFSVLDSANAGDDAPEGFINSANDNITYTLTAGTDTAEVFICLPYIIAR